MLVPDLHKLSIPVGPGIYTIYINGKVTKVPWYLCTGQYIFRQGFQ